MPVRGGCAVQVRVMAPSCPWRPGVGNSPPVDAPETPPTLDQLNGEIRDVALAGPPGRGAQGRARRRRGGARRRRPPVAALPRDAAVAVARRADESRARAGTAGDRSQAHGVAAARRFPRRSRPRARPTARPAAARPKIAASRASRGRTSAARPTAKLGVGADVESWCGKCGETTTHSIVAMVGDEPKQVLCQVCGSRHTHRTGPARRDVDGRRRDRRRRPPARRRPRGPAEGRRAARAGRRGRGRDDGSRLRSEGALQGGRDHRPRRVRPREDRERPALQPAGPLLRSAA